MVEMCPRKLVATTARWLTLTAFAVALVTVSGVAQADPPGPDALSVKVLAVKSDSAFEQAEALTRALRQAVRDSKGWSLGEGNQSLEFLVLEMKCGTVDAACETRIADVIKADRFLWSEIEMTDDGKNVAGALNFFQRGQGTSKVEVRYSANLTEATDDFLIKEAKNALEEVTGGRPKGTLKISSGGVAGQLFVDGKPFGALAADGGSFQLPSGDHTVVVKAQGYADAQGSTAILPAQTAELTLTMVAVEEAKPVDTRMVGGFVGIGLGVAAGAVGLWSALEVNTIKGDQGFTQYRAGLTTKQNACEEARNGFQVTTVGGAAAPAAVADLCDQADTHELIQAVTFPVAAIATGVGIYLLGTSSLLGGDDSDGEPSALRIEPHVGPDLQSVSVTYAF